MTVGDLLTMISHVFGTFLYLGSRVGLSVKEDHDLACSERECSLKSLCFTFISLLSILYFTTPHSLPPLTWCPPFMIKVQATDDLTLSQNIPAREGEAKPLLSKGNQGHADPAEVLSAKHATNRKMEDKASVGIFNAQHFYPYVPVELAQQVGGDRICLTRALHNHTILVTSVLSS